MAGSINGNDDYFGRMVTGRGEACLARESPGNCAADGGVSENVPCGCAVLAYLGLPFADGMARTIHFQREEWANNSWGIHDVDRSRASGVVAISSDGSRANRVQSSYKRFHVISQGAFSVHGIYDSKSHIAYRIDHDRKTATEVRCSCTWGRIGEHENDPECARAAKEAFDNPQRLGWGKVAGVSVIRYRGDEGGVEAEVSFADQYACEIMDQVRIKRNWIGLPTYYWHLSITAYIPGEPVRERFLPPMGYRLDVENR